MRSRVDDFSVGPDSLACGLAAYTGKAILTADIKEDERWARWRWMAEWFDYRGCRSFPIRASGRKAIGTLAIYTRQPRKAKEPDVRGARTMRTKGSRSVAITKS